MYGLAMNILKNEMIYYANGLIISSSVMDCYSIYCYTWKNHLLFSSILDQQQKQAIPFQGGTFLGNFDGRIFVASTREIYSLVPVAWEKQVSIVVASSKQFDSI